MKKFLSILVIGLILIPNQMFASSVIKVAGKSYETLNFEEALAQEGIEHDLSNYKETDDQAVIYLFRGHGCSFCKNFLTFLNSIVGEYGQYFKVVSFETWQSQENATLLEEVATFLGADAGGVPFIIIGDRVFPGYSDSYNDQIKAAIMDQYESKNSYDVMKELEKSKNKMDSSVVIILWNLVFFITSTTIILIFMNTKQKQTMLTLEEVQKELKDFKKIQGSSKESTKGKKKSV